MTNQASILTRRDFVRGTVAATLSVSVLSGKQTPAAAAEGKSRVVLVRDENVLNAERQVDTAILKTMLDDTVIQVTGKASAKEAWLSLFTPEDKIGLVPTPHLNKTHQEVIDGIVQCLEEAGIPKAQINPNCQGSVDKIEDRTALIAVPALKAHWLTGVGTVLKNYIMYSGKPRDYHNENSAKLGEIWNLPAVQGKTKLILVDALTPLCDKGPQPDPRYVWPYHGVIAGTDPVAVEAVGLKIIESKREAMQGEPWPLTPPPLCVETAEKTYKLGCSDWSQIELAKFGWEQDILV